MKINNFFFFSFLFSHVCNNFVTKRRFHDSLRWAIYIIKSHVKTESSCYTPHRHSTTVFLDRFFDRLIDSLLKYIAAR